MNNKITTNERLVLTYYHLRKIIGVIAISLPFILLFGNLLFFNHYGIESSISHYYYTDMRNVFVGILFAFGVFLFSYKGHERKDDIAGDLACLFAVGVALFPTTPTETATTITGYIHVTCAALFFLTLSYFSLFLFTKTDPNKTPSPQKYIRNRVYRACGIIMLACMVLVVIYYQLPDSSKMFLAYYKPVFTLETLMVVAFGISWFTKGRGLYADEALEII